jgi:leader peptidase (prepilin peptidase)/N-methyltransferase
VRAQVVEVAISIALGGVVWLAFRPVAASIPSLAVAAVAPRLTLLDLTEHRLPNRLVVPPLIAGIAALGLGWAATGVPPLVPLLAAAIYSGALFVLALFGGIGMGDVKLAAALGLASPTLAVAVGSPLLAFLCGGIAAMAVLIRRGPRARIAFGPFLLAGYFAALAAGGLLRPV